MGPDNVLLINVSKEEADSFAPLYKENSLAIPFNNDEQFWLYLLGEPVSAWNKGAATVFTNWLLDNQKIAPQNRYEVDAIRTAFLAHIRFLHSKYVQSSKTLEEQDRKARKQTVDARKRNMYNMRGEAINLFEALQRFRKLWNILGVDGTSSDEEVLIEGQRQYQILNLHCAANPSESFAGNLMCYTFPCAQKGRIPMEKFRLGGCHAASETRGQYLHQKPSAPQSWAYPLTATTLNGSKRRRQSFRALPTFDSRPTSSIDFSLPEDLERLIELTLKGTMEMQCEKCNQLALHPSGSTSRLRLDI
ncbi:hypothetical protein BT96DRAFT_1009389 [Gymnopus androsaceus JB14]|uniref:Uncharacterized protein n=1 Tax=Gymnopus androsaceus JB14 TaxID=1447944 RepID=A0A6A4GCY8_9AGAR|nr:hypothetical protein BT96DRAFT_1009389 [Gymnopus androsaceus JB14]